MKMLYAAVAFVIVAIFAMFGNLVIHLGMTPSEGGTVSVGALFLAGVALAFFAIRTKQITPPADR